MINIEKTFKKIIVPKMKGKEDKIRIYIKEFVFNEKPSPHINFDINETLLSSVTINALAGWLIT